MSKKEEEILMKLGGHDAKMILKSPVEREKEQKRINKLNAMRIALTYIEGQNLVEVTPEKATEIADKFLSWIEKK